MGGGRAEMREREKKERGERERKTERCRNRIWGETRCAMRDDYAMRDDNVDMSAYGANRSEKVGRDMGPDR